MKQFYLTLSLLMACLLGACASSSSQAVKLQLNPEFRRAVPPPGPSPILVAPEAILTRLPNGLTLITIEKRNLPLVHATMVFKSGSASDPANRWGLAGFTNTILKTGTTSLSSNEIADAVETRGSSIGNHVGGDSSSLSFRALTESFHPVLEVFADIIKNPSFTPAEIERQRVQRLTALSQASDSPQRTANVVFHRTLYGPHPYGHTVLGNESSLKDITAEDLRSFYNNHYRPENAALIIVGDISSKDARSAVEKSFGQWSAGKGVTLPPEAPSPPAPGVFLVNKANAPQSQLRIGHLGVARTNPDYFSIVLMNAILGGTFNSRINMNLREDKGYTYGAGSHFDFRKSVGPFAVSTGVRTDVTLPAIEEVLKEIKTMRETDASEEELQNAKNRYSLALPGYFQTVGGIASMYSKVFTFDLPLDYYRELPGKLAAVSVADVRMAAQKYLHPDTMVILVVGDKAQVAGELPKLNRGDLQELDSTGDPL